MADWQRVECADDGAAGQRPFVDLVRLDAAVLKRLLYALILQEIAEHTADTHADERAERAIGETGNTASEGAEDGASTVCKRTSAAADGGSGGCTSRTASLCCRPHRTDHLADRLADIRQGSAGRQTDVGETLDRQLRVGRVRRLAPDLQHLGDLLLGR